MNHIRLVSTLSGVLILTLSGALLTAADESDLGQQLPVAHGECTAFTAGGREAMALNSLAGAKVSRHYLSRNTGDVLRTMVNASSLPALSRPKSFDQTSTQLGTIDSYLSADMQAAGVQPAGLTTDWEFIRRVTLDLTGRIPTPDRVLAFVNDKTPNKRAALIDELLASPQWVDKWTMFYGDLFQNTSNRPSTSLNRFPAGRNAFYTWLHDSLSNDKPYDQMATELMTGRGSNSYTQGELNWILNGYITGGPQQDITDSMATNVSTAFLGISHMNCLLCHNGRGHLDQLSLWGSRTTRYAAWQFASFLSHTTFSTVRYDPNNRNVYYWSVQDNVTHDYQLGTTTGNRPARAPDPGCAAGKPCYVAPIYIFNGAKPNGNENYRSALARLITSDPQFSRAAVNYLWAYFFGRGIVDPPDQFDPMRLDPNNPPPDPWTLQPTNANLLNALAQQFAQNGYDLKWLMRTIANSNAYQLASEYPGQWNEAWEPLFARKFVRRLWGEEIHDAVAMSSGQMPSYKVAGFSESGFPNVSMAMQLPDVTDMGGVGVNAFLDSFLRGDRDLQQRRSDGSILQTLGLMNDPFVMSRIDPGGNNSNQLLSQNLNKPTDQMINALFLGVLSRYPTASEMTTATNIVNGGGSKASGAVNLLWSLYNKVDFIFNY